MRKVILIGALLLGTSAVAQDNSFYASVGISTASGDNFKSASYSSVEVGRMWDNFALGVCAGSSDLHFEGGPGGYWWEAKGSIYFPVKTFQWYFLAGAGNYIGTDRTLIEYGGGITRQIGQTPLYWFLQASSWDSNAYTSAGFSVVFGN